MPVRIQLPRLSRNDVEELARGHVCIVRCDAMLKDSKWAGAPAAIELIGIADQAIARVFNKADGSLTRQLAAAQAETASGAPSASGPAGAAGQEQIAGAAKPEA